MRKVLVALAFVLLVPTVAVAQTPSSDAARRADHHAVRGGFISGNTLVENMKEFEKREAGSKDAGCVAASLYMGYVTGVYDATEPLYLYGLGAQGDVGQICVVVANYLKDHPEQWDEPAVALVVRALRKAFPPEVTSPER